MAGSTGPSSSAVANVRCRRRWARSARCGLSVRMRSASSGRWPARRPRAARSAPPPRWKRRGVDALLSGVVVLDVVEDRDGCSARRSTVGLRHEAPQHRARIPRRARRGRDEPGRSRVQPAGAGAVVQRAGRAARARAGRRPARGGCTPRARRRAMRRRSLPATCGGAGRATRRTGRCWSCARRTSRCCSLVSSSPFQSENPTQTMSRPQGSCGVLARSASARSRTASGVSRVVAAEHELARGGRQRASARLARRPKATTASTGAAAPRRPGARDAQRPAAADAPAARAARCRSGGAAVASSTRRPAAAAWVAQAAARRAAASLPATDATRTEPRRARHAPKCWDGGRPSARGRRRGGAARGGSTRARHRRRRGRS